MRRPSLPRLPSNALLVGVGLAVPLVMLFGFVQRFGVNLPIADGWDEGRFLLAWQRQGPSWSLLFSPHNEHVMAVPRLMALALAALTRWNVKAEMVAGALFASVAVAVLLLAVRRLAPASPRWRAFLAVTLAFLMLGWIQWQNWLWGFQLAWLMTVSFVVAAMTLLALAPPRTTTVLLAAASLTCATFSSAGGWLGWLAAAPLAVVGAGEGPHVSVRRRIALIGLYTAVFALATTVFLSGPTRPRPAPLIILEHPLEFARFTLSMLGWVVLAPLHHGASLPGLASPIAVLSPIVGGALCVAYLVASAWGIVARLHLTRLFWLAQGLTLFGLGFAALVAVGRLGFGAEMAFQSRYVTFTQFAVAGLLMLLTMAAAARGRRHRPVASAVGTVLGATIVAGSLLAYATFGRFGTDMLQAHAGLRAALQLSEVLPQPDALRRLARQHDPAPLLALVGDLERLGLYCPPRLHPGPDGLLPASAVCPSGTVPRGRVESRRLANGQLLLSGWAVLPEHPRPADTVIAARRTGSALRLLAVDTPQRVARPDVARSLHDDAFLLSGWTLRLAGEAAGGGDDVMALAFDGETNCLYELPGP